LGGGGAIKGGGKRPTQRSHGLLKVGGGVKMGSTRAVAGRLCILWKGTDGGKELSGPKAAHNCNGYCHALLWVVTRRKTQKRGLAKEKQIPNH